MAHSQFRAATRAKMIFRRRSTCMSLTPYFRHCRNTSVVSCRARLREMVRQRCEVKGLTRKRRVSQLWWTEMLRCATVASSV